MAEYMHFSFNIEIIYSDLFDPDSENCFQCIINFKRSIQETLNEIRSPNAKQQS